MGNGVSFFTPNKEMAGRASMAMMQGGRQVYGMPGAFYGKGFDSAVASGMAYITGELEKMDPKVREPLTSVTWQRDMVAKTGGGWVEYTSTYNVDYGTTGPNDLSIVGTASNTIPVMQVSTEKNLYKVFTWMHMMRINFVDMAKAKQIGRSLEDMLNKGIRLNYNKSLDMNVYKGFEKLGTTGLVNDPNVVVATADNGASGKATWKDKTPDEILDDINQAITAAWVASEYDLDGMPNHILIPPQQYTLLVTRKVSEAGNCSLLEYLMNNNIAKNQGRSISIYPSRWCIKAGTGQTDRMVAYMNDEDKVNFDITVPITRAMSSPNLSAAAYDTLYAAQIGQVKFNYYQPVRYIDGI
jgi:hypothetical protein